MELHASSDLLIPNRHFAVRGVHYQDGSPAV